VGFWDALTGVHQRTLFGHTPGILPVDFRATGNYLAVGGADHRVLFIQGKNP